MRNETIQELLYELHHSVHPKKDTIDILLKDGEHIKTTLYELNIGLRNSIGIRGRYIDNSAIKEVIVEV